MTTRVLPRPGRAAVRLAAFTLVAAAALTSRAAEEPPAEWIDRDTGHRVVRLSREPGTASLYFHQNGYTPDGSRVLVTTSGGGLATIHLQTRETIVLVAEPVSVLVVGRKSGDVYYTKRGARAEEGKPREPSAVWAVNVETKAARKVATLPLGATVSSLNADETLLLGLYQETADGTPAPPVERPERERNPQTFQANYQAVGADGKPMPYAEAKELSMHGTLQQALRGLPRAIFTLHTGTGEVKVVHRDARWFGHLQFSPTDPQQLMFCHEGPWHEVDRLWLLRTEGGVPAKVHTRTMNMEIWGHEFFSADGKTVWYDLQTPRGEDFWVAGFEPASGRRTWYHLQRNEWSVHFNVSADGKLFCGDGGDPEMVAHAPDGKWIYLFRPRGIPDVAGIKAPNSESLIHSGVFESERLVNLSAHDYRLEPNVSFTPDGKWIVFRSNLHGAVHTYAVEVAKAK